jgi:hypothetical protein
MAQLHRDTKLALNVPRSDPDGDALTFEWDLDNDGVFEAWAGTCRRLVIQLRDGTMHEAVFQFK